MEMAKTYEPQSFEKDLYHWWEKEGFFTTAPPVHRTDYNT